jgi:uncharacterized membrane-anchored protein YitT (DUF2179 family)
MNVSKNKVLEWIYITIGVALSAFSFSFFLDPKNLVIGGVSGVGVIIRQMFGADPALVILLINVGLLIVGLFFLGKEFFAKTVYGSIMFPVFIKLFDIVYKALEMKPIQDTLLVIMFSSIIMGVGLGMTVKFGGTTGGVDIPQNILLKYFHIPFSVSLFFIDGLIILFGYFAIPEADVSLILYGIFFIFLSGFATDQVVFSGFNKRAVSIVSCKNEEIKQRILTDLGRGVTKIKVYGGWSNQEKTNLICVLSTFEFYKLKKIINEYDPNAFFYAVRASEVSGEGFTYGK